MQIAKWAKENKLEIIEKAEPIIEIKAQLEKVAKALEIMKGSGYNSEVMQIYLQQKTKLSRKAIENMLYYQNDFFKAIGVVQRK